MGRLGSGRTSALVVSVAALLLAGCSEGDPRSGPPVEAGSAEAPTLVVRNQSSDGTSLLLDEIAPPGEGAFIVVYLDGAGAPGQQVAVSDRLSGRAEGPDVEVAFDEEVPAGDLWLVVHTDTDADGEFDHEVDAAMTQDGAVVAARVEISR